MTKRASVENGIASWNEELSIIATLDKDSKGRYEPKTYDFRVQSLEGDQRYTTLGKVTIDMASHMDARRKSLALPVTLASGGQVVLTIVVTASPVKGLIGDDDASVISGVSGISGSPVGMEQDLNGFDMGSRGSSGALSDTAKAATSADAAPRASHEHQMSPLSSIPERQSSEVAAAVQELEQESAPPADTQEHEEVSVGTPPAALSAPSEAPPPEPQATVDTPQSQEGDSATPQSGSMGELAHEDDVHEAEGEHEEQYHDEHAEGEEEEEYYDEYDGADVAELEERLHAAEEAAAEAEAMAEEAVAMLESEQAGKRQAEALVAQLQRELEWAGKKAAKERTEWEARMKDSFKKMEGTVLLTERVQREKAELTDRLAALAAENRNLQSMLDPAVVERRVAEAAAAAKEAAETQAAIEAEALRKRILEMETFVEEADAKALQASGRVAHLQAQLAGAKGAGPGGTGVVDGWEEVRAAEERADALSLELQYAKAECRSLEQDVRSAKAEADRAIMAARREAESHAARAADFARQLEQARAAAAAAERNASKVQAHAVLLEDAVERSNLQAAELRQRLAAIRPSTDNGEPSADLQMAMQQVREVQDAAETRAAALATTSRELVAAQDALVAAHAELEAVRQDLADAQRVVTAREEEVRQLKDQLEAKESLALELKQMQRDMAALLAGGTSAKVSPRPGSGASGPADAAALQAAATAAMRAPTEDGEAVDVLRRRTAEAQELARSAAMQAADLVQQLATSQAERQDAAARVADMREELVKLRSSAQGELVVRIEALERDLVVARNRADVNALFRDEHERIAGDLIATKLALAEAQEQLVVLRRSLVKSQERSMSFASKLTSLETKLYRRLSNAAVRIRGGSNNGSTSSEAEIDAALGDVSKQDTSGSSRRRGKARKA